MTEADLPAAVVRIGDGSFGLVTDAMLRARVLVAGRPASTPVHEVMGTEPSTVVLGDSAAEALMRMLDRAADFTLVTDRAGARRRSEPPVTAPAARRPRGARCTSSCAGRAPPTSWSRAPSASRACSPTCGRGVWRPER